MAILPVTGRFAPPLLPSALLTRPRLDRRWDEVRSRRLLLVTAGAGFGKSAFLISQAKREERSVFWSGEDLDPIAFLRELAASWRGVDADANPSSLLSAVIDHLWIHPCVLVIDPLPDYPAAAPQLDLLSQFARHLPEGNLLVLASRGVPLIPIAKLEAAQASARIAADDLCFDEEEIAALFNHRFGRSPSPRVVRRIRIATEGWPAGMELLLQAAGSATDIAIESALERGREAEARWFDFCAQEVLDKLDAASRRFLIEAAGLPRLEPALVDRLLRRRDSGSLLRSLRERNLFLARACGAGESYRLLAPFRDFLLTRQEVELTNTARRTLHLRSAVEWKREGRPAEAALAFVRADAPARALALLESMGGELPPEREVLDALFALLPARTVAQRPRLLLLRARWQENRGDWDAALETTRRALALHPDPRTRAELVCLRARTSTRRGHYASASRTSRAALRVLPQSKGAAPVRGFLLATLATAEAELGQLERAEATLHRALTVARAARDRDGEGRALYLLAANVYMKRGEFTRAEEAGRRALAIFKSLGDPRALCHAMEVLSETVLAAGRIADAKELAQLALHTAEDLEYRMIEGYCHLVLARAARLEGRPDAAEPHLKSAGVIGEETGEIELRIAPLLERAEAHGADGRIEDARTWAEAARRETAVGCGPLLVARIELLLGGWSGPRRGRAWLRRAEATFRRVHARFDLHRAWLIRISTGDVPRAKRAALLRALLSGAASAHHETLFLHHERERGIERLLEGLESGVERVFCLGLLAQHGAAALPPLLARLANPTPELRRCAFELLATMKDDDARVLRSALVQGSASQSADAAAPGLTLRLLGALSVTRGEAQWQLEGWNSKRALRLFLFLCARRFRWIARDEILESLWPELDLDRALNNLKQSVFLLRRQLEPSHTPRYLLHSADAYRLDPGEGHDYDVERFEAALADGDRAARRGDLIVEEGALRTAIESYRGDWCEELPFEDFLARERERLRERWLGGLEHLLRHLAASRRHDELLPLARLGLERDPLREALHDAYTTALEATGRHAEARVAQRDFEQRYVRELGLFPAPRLRGTNGPRPAV